MGEISTRLKTAMEKAGVKPHTLAAALTRQSVRGGSLWRHPELPVRQI